MSHIRIESHEKLVRDAKVFFVNGEEETDISSCISAAYIDLEVGEVATVTLRAYLGHARLSGDIEEILLAYVPRKRRWWHRLREVTSFSDRRRRHA